MMEVGDAAIVRRASPAVVNIAEWKVHAATQPDQSPRRVKVPMRRASSSTRREIIVTNKHVVDGALDMHVIFSNGDRVPARLLAAAAMLDLAVLKVDVGHPLPALKWANSDALRIGDPVLTIGNPLGLLDATLLSPQRTHQVAGRSTTLIMCGANAAMHRRAR